MVEEARRFWGTLSEAKGDENRLPAERKVTLAFRTEILELKTTTGLLVGSFHKVKARAAETERGLQKAQGAVAVSKLQHKTLKEKFTFLTEELSLIRVESANVKADLDEISALVYRLRDDVDKLISNVSTEVAKTYGDMVDAAKLKIQADLVDR